MHLSGSPQKDLHSHQQFLDAEGLVQHFVHPQFPGDGEIVRADPAFVYGVSHSIDEHGRDRGFEIRIGFIEQLMPHAGGILVTGEAYDLAHQEALQFGAFGMVGG